MRLKSFSLFYHAKKSEKDTNPESLLASQKKPSGFFMKNRIRYIG